MTTSGHNFLTFLAIAQFYQVDIVPITWEFALDGTSPSGTAKIHESVLEVNRNFVFKRTRITSLPHNDFNDESIENRMYNALVAELSILCHPLLRVHPLIIKLVGITWEVSETGDGVWPVIILEKAQLGDLHYFMTTEMAKTLSVKEKLCLCADVASAIVALHTYSASNKICIVLIR